VVGEASAVLGGARARIAAAVGLVAILLVYDATAMRLPDLGDWGDVFWTGIVLGVPLFGLLLLALPLAQRGRGWLLGAVGVFAAVAIGAGPGRRREHREARGRRVRRLSVRELLRGRELARGRRRRDHDR
jgi:hypothetical protein